MAALQQLGEHDIFYKSHFCEHILDYEEEEEE